MKQEINRIMSDLTSVLEQAAHLPHSEPHYQATCVRCAARASLSWEDEHPPFLDSDVWGIAAQARRVTEGAKRFESAFADIARRDRVAMIPWFVWFVPYRLRLTWGWEMRWPTRGHRAR